MSTLSVTNLKHGSSATNNIVLDSSGNMTAGGTLAMSSSFMRNRIINGAMVIDQRNAGAAVTLTNANFTYGVDRWAATVSTSTSTVTSQRVSTGISSFPFATRILRGSGTYTGSSSLIQAIETLNCQDLAGLTVTVSFWARKGSAASNSSFYLQGISGSGSDQGITGAYNGSWTGWSAPVLGIPSLTTSFAQYTYTWNVPAGTNEMALFFVVSSYSGTGSANDYVDITGVQLEVGTVATPFERRLYGQELALCQRYFSLTPLVGTGIASGTTSFDFVPAYPVQMRATPTFTANSTLTITDVTSADYSQSSALLSSVIASGSTSAFLRFGNFSGLTAGKVYIARNANMFVNTSAEL